VNFWNAVLFCVIQLAVFYCVCVFITSSVIVICDISNYSQTISQYLTHYKAVFDLGL